jgi:hypothetical protein
METYIKVSFNQMHGFYYEFTATLSANVFYLYHSSAGILEQAMGDRNRVGGLSYRPGRGEF